MSISNRTAAVVTFVAFVWLFQFFWFRSAHDYYYQTGTIVRMGACETNTGMVPGPGCSVEVKLPDGHTAFREVQSPAIVGQPVYVLCWKEKDEKRFCDVQWVKGTPP